MTTISPNDSCMLKNDVQVKDRWLVYAHKDDKRFLFVAAAKDEKESLKIGRDNFPSMTRSAWAILERLVVKR